MSPAASCRPPTSCPRSTALQIEIAASVEEQAIVLAEVTRQLSTATAASQEILTGLDGLIATASES